MDVFVFTACSSLSGLAVIAVLRHEPQLEEQWELLRQHVLQHLLEEEVADQLQSRMDNWSGSDFEVHRLPLLD